MRIALLMMAALMLTACARAGKEAVPESLSNLANVQGAVLGTTLDGEAITFGEGALEGKAVILNYFHST
jgi:hypothetical protein